jgi:LPXTG-motif cell wall-anchored protein
MRTLIRFGALAVATSAAVLTAPFAAYATPPGDNGTVKIHDAATGEELKKNEPHVCTFYLDAFGFDGGQRVDWHIEAWAPTAKVKGETVKSGALSLDAAGHGRTEDLSLSDGHYKLFWNFDGEHGSAKHKVFWTDCDGDVNAQEEGYGEEDDKDASTPSDGAKSDPASESPSDPASESPSDPAASASPQGGTGGDLAETGAGAPVGPVAAVAGVLVAAGGYLVFRRRRAGGRG